MSKPELQPILDRTEADRDAPQSPWGASGALRDDYVLRLANRSGAVLLGTSLNLALQFLLWYTISRGKICHSKTSPSLLRDPGACHPPRIVTVISLVYAVVLSSVCATVISRITLGPELSRGARVFRQLCMLSLSLLPSWAWASVLLRFGSMGSRTFGVYAATFLVSVVVVFSISFLIWLVNEPARASRVPFITTDLESILSAAAFLVAVMWIGAINTRSNAAKHIVRQLCVAIAVSFVMGVVVCFLPFDSPSFSSTTDKARLHFCEEFCSTLVGQSWNAFLTSVVATIALPPVWSALVLSVLVTFCAWLTVLVMRIRAAEMGPREKRQSVHLSSSALGAVVGHCWGMFAESSFVLIPNETVGAISVTAYPVFVGVVFFLAISMASHMKFGQGQL